MAFTATRLLAQIKIKGSLPEGRFTDQELLDFAYDSLLSEIVPAIVMSREDYLVTYADQSITASQAAYPIPARALNGTVREIKLVRADGVIVDLPRIDLEDVRGTDYTGETAFYVSGDDIIVYPTPTTTQDSLRVYYSARPSRLVPDDECAAITAINTATKTVTITIPTGWTTANTFDLVKGTGRFQPLGVDLTATSVTGGEIVFTNTLPTTLAVGDYVTLAQETCLAPIPPEGHVALVQAAVTSALESIGNPLSDKSAAKAQALLVAFKAVLSTRVEGAPKALGRRIL